MSLYDAWTSPIRLPMAAFDFREDSGSVAHHDTSSDGLKRFRIPSLPALLDILNVPTIPVCPASPAPGSLRRDKPLLCL